MSTITEYPFQLDNAFFTHIEFHRKTTVNGGEFQFNVTVNVNEDDFPNTLQVNLVVSASQPIHIHLELVGLFSATQECSTPADEFIPRFLNNRALFMLWPYLTYIIKQLTATMGMEPINIKAPDRYNVALLDNSRTS